jgi:hypothetical protein
VRFLSQAWWTCHISQATLGVAHRDFSVLALLPKHDVADIPPYIFLGTQFLFEYRAELVLGCSAEIPAGRLVIP